MVEVALIIILSYLVGSIPTSYLIGKILRGIDIRKHGSGNVGATNIFRVLGPAPGILVLLIDMAKGLIPVAVITPWIAGCFGAEPVPYLTRDWLRIISGISAISGHNWTVFLKFRGGKGVATSVGVLLGISAKSLGLSAIVWVIVTLVSRYVSLGSIISAVSLPVFMFLGREDEATVLFGIVIAILIIIRHRSNIIRLINHRENKITLGRRRA